MIPWLSHCADELFTAYDPPSTLKAGTALAPPPVSHSDPKVHPGASPTLNLEAGQTLGAKNSMPVPANTPTLDQPKATVTTASAPPKQKEPDFGPQPNDPGAQESPSPQSRLNTIAANSDPKGSNDPDQGSDPHQGSGDNGGSGQVHKSQGSDRNADSVPQLDSKQTYAVDPSDDFTEGQPKTIDDQDVETPSHGTPTPMTTTIGGQAITAASNVVAIAGNTLSPGAPGTTVDGTVLSLDTAGRFVVGSKTISLTSKVPQTITTNIVGQAITAAPNAIIVAGTTLSPGDPGITLAGTLIYLDTASHLILGPKTLALESESQNSIATKIGGEVITVAPNGIAIAGTALTPGASGVTVGGTLVSLNAAGHLIVGPKTIALQSGSVGVGGLIMGGIGAGPSSGVANSFTTTIDGQVITVGSTALVMAGATLTPGAPGVAINGTLVSLDTAAQLMVGSKTIPLGSEKAGLREKSVGLAGLVMGAFGSGGPFGPFETNPAAPAQGNVSTGGVNGTSAGVLVFRGSGASLKSRYWWSKMAVSATVMAALMCVC